MVPHSARGDGPGELPANPRVRARARRRTGGYRLGRARPAGRPDEPSTSRAGQPRREPGGAASIEGHDPLAAAGGSLRDVSRVAGANPRIWVDIFLDNRDELLAALADHRRAVEHVEAALEAREGSCSARWIGEAAGNRRRCCGQRTPLTPATSIAFGPTCRTRLGISPRSRRRSVRSASTSRTSSSTTSRRSAAACSESS